MKNLKNILPLLSYLHASLTTLQVTDSLFRSWQVGCTFLLVKSSIRCVQWHKFIKYTHCNFRKLLKLKLPDRIPGYNSTAKIVVLTFRGLQEYAVIHTEKL